MSLRKMPFINDNFYHIYNRGVDKKIIFQNTSGYMRFLQCILELNTEKSLGGLYTKSYLKKKHPEQTTYNNKIVDVIAYCLNPNHFHLILKQKVDGGISKFMQRLGTGYSMYFNIQNKRSGALFQGKFKSTHIDTNEYLLYLSAYVNLNDKVHVLEQNVETFSSLKEYTEEIPGICEKSIILGQFTNKIKYKEFLDSSLPELVRQKAEKRELRELGLV